LIFCSLVIVFEVNLISFANTLLLYPWKLFL
jgi:hypothetical protein